VDCKGGRFDDARPAETERNLGFSLPLSHGAPRISTNLMGINIQDREIFSANIFDMVEMYLTK
jgi:hypothetical protein